MNQRQLAEKAVPRFTVYLAVHKPLGTLNADRTTVD